MEYGYLRQDESSHWYLVPSDKVGDFDALTSQIERYEEYTDKWGELVNKFIDDFDKYRTGGGVSHLKVLI